jgi:hypothetical protein
MKWLGVVTLASEHPITLFDALPITVEELQRFRENGAAHAAWVEERLAKQDYGEIHARWTSLFES